MGKRSIFFRSFERKRLIFPIIVCLALILGLNTESGRRLSDNIRNHLITMTEKVSSGFQNVSGKINSIRYFFSNDLNRAVLDLHKENLQLKYEVEELTSLKNENQELRKLLKLKQQMPDKILIVRISNMFSNDYVRSCIISAGARDGLEIGDVVRNLDGFVGRIADVHDAWSCVLLLTDTNSKIAVKIGKEKINAIISGDNSDKLTISMKNDDAKINDGDYVETAYFESTVCNGIPVGKIVKNDETFQIEPFVNFNLMNYVCILKNK